MVDADVQKAQQSLEAQKVIAQAQVQQQIKPRRFGASVIAGREAQQRVLEQRQAGQTALREIETRRKELVNIQKQRDVIKAQVAVQETRQSRISNVLSRVSRGKTVGSDFSKLSKADRQLINEAIKISEDRGERAAVRAVESQLGQSLPQASRDIILRQLSEGAKTVTIPTLKEVGVGVTPRVQTLASIEDLPKIPTILQSFEPSITTGTKPGQRGILIVGEGELPPTRGGFVVSSDFPFTEAVGAGVIAAGFPTTRISPLSKVFGLTTEEIITEKATGIEARLTAERVIDIKKELRADPEKFIGLPGVLATDREITLTNEFFLNEIGDVRKKAVKQAREEFEALPRSRQFLSVISSGVTLGGKFGVGGLEFGATILTEGLKIQEPGRPFEFFEFEKGALADIRESPLIAPRSVGFLEAPGTFLKEAAGPQVVFGGALLTAGGVAAGKQLIRSAREFGTVEALSETASILSPLSIRSTILAPEVTAATKLKGFGFKRTKGDITRRQLIFGADDIDATIIVTQEAKTLPSGEKILVGQVGEVFTPIIEIRGGGGFVREGLRRTTTEALGLGKPTQPLLIREKTFGGEVKIREGEFKNLLAGETDLFEKQASDVFVIGGRKPRGFGTIGGGEFDVFGGAAITRKVPKKPITTFIAGERKPPVIVRGREVSEFPTTIKGFEIDLNKATLGKEGAGEVFRSSGRKSSKTFLETLQEQDTTLQSALATGEASLRRIPKPPKVTKPTAFIDVPIILGSGLPRSVGGTGLKDIPRPSSFGKADLSFTDIQPLAFNIPKAKVSPLEKLTDLTASDISVKTSIKSLEKQSALEKQLQQTRLKQLTKQITQQASKSKQAQRVVAGQKARLATQAKARLAAGAKATARARVRVGVPFGFGAGIGLPRFDFKEPKDIISRRKKKKEDDFLIFAQSFTGKLIGKKERRTLGEFRERALNLNLASITGRPIVIKRKKSSKRKAPKKQTRKKRKR